VELKQGQLWWANLPEPVGWRPVLVLTRTDALKQLHWVTVAPLTRTIRNLPSEALLAPVEGVPQRCAVTLDNIATVEQPCLVQFICELSEERMADVWDAIRFAFAMPH